MVDLDSRNDHGEERAYPAVTPLTNAWLGTAGTLARAGRAVGVRPNTVTGFRLVLSLCGVPLAARGGRWLIVAAFLVVLTALADSVDGALAEVTGLGSPLGQVYDGLADRLSEACWLIVFALLGAGAWLVAACGGLTWLHDYLRARATVAGMPKVEILTVGERPTRTTIIVFALLFAGVGEPISRDLPVGIVTAASAIWALLQAAALVQLFVAVRSALR